MYQNSCLVLAGDLLCEFFSDNDAVAASWLSGYAGIRKLQAIAAGASWWCTGNPTNSISNASLHWYRAQRITGKSLKSIVIAGISTNLIVRYLFWVRWFALTSRKKTRNQMGYQLMPIFTLTSLFYAVIVDIWHVAWNCKYMSSFSTCRWVTYYICYHVWVLPIAQSDSCRSSLV